MSNSVDPEAPLMSSKPPKPVEQEPLITNHELDDDDDQEEESVWDDARDTVLLGIPIFLAMFSWVGMKTTDTALLGHVSADALAAAALSDLWTMCSAVLIQGRVLGVLCGAAVGAGNPKLAGIYLQVSYYILSFVCVFVFACWYLTEWIWDTFGSDPKIAHMAGYYAKVLAWSLPGQLAFSQLSQFFSSQRIMYPEVNAASVALIVNLVLGLVLVLGMLVPGWNGFGFAACPIVTTCVVYVQFFFFWFVYIHVRKLHERCWDGWSYADITWERIKIFCTFWLPQTCLHQSVMIPSFSLFPLLLFLQATCIFPLLWAWPRTFGAWVWWALSRPNWAKKRWPSLIPDTASCGLC